METLLKFEDAVLGYKGKPALEGVNLSVERGELLALAGPNGSGKTTLLKAAAGLIEPFSGRALLSGKNASGLSRLEKASLAALLFQGTESSWRFTVGEIVRQGAYAKEALVPWNKRKTKEASILEAVQNALRETGLESYAERFVTELSGGELRRVFLARALAQGAPLLLLDEPLSGLDPKFQRSVMKLLQELAQRGYGILHSVHDLQFSALYADKLAFISREGAAPGRIAYIGSPAELLKPEILEEIYGVRFSVETGIET